MELYASVFHYYNNWISFANTTNKVVPAGVQADQDRRMVKMTTEGLLNFLLL